MGSNVKTSTYVGRIVFLAVAVVGAATLEAGPSAAQSAAPDAMCWRSLAPDAGPQDLGMIIAESALAANGSSEAWVSWQDDNAQILRWVLGRWTPMPLPSRDGVEPMWNPVVAASPSGRIFVAASANDDAGRSALHIARTTDGSWEWLGAPLISSQEPYTHAQEPSIAFLEGDRPVVAWSEEREVQLAGLFVALWNGSSWTRLGTLTPSGEVYFLSPAIAVDASESIWIAWNEAPGRVRIARWDGAAWRDVGRDALERITADKGPVFGDLSLAVDRKGRVWVLWLEARASGLGLAMARWDGVDWAAVPAPRGLAGKDSTVSSATMILHDDAPIVAWSQADASDNRYLHVSQWIAGDQWSARLSGLHLVEGVSNVGDVRVAAGQGQDLFVSWDEPGKDQRRTRLVQAYTCAAGETPAAPPTSVVERDTWPTTVDEAARQIVAALNDESKALVRATSKDDLMKYYFGWGTGIRNSLGLWRGNERLLESCGRGKRSDPEACSMVIIEAVWTLLQTPSPKPEVPRR
jgi:hypothetical protein